MRNVIASLLCLCTLGCASATSTMLSEDTAIISAEGNGPSDRDRIIRDALAEAARVTSAHGYRYFVVLTADDLTSTLTVRVPGRTLYNQPPRSNEPFEAYTGRAYASGGSTYTTPERKVQRITPAIDIMIRMYREGEIQEGDGIWDAAAVLDPATVSR